MQIFFSLKFKGFPSASCVLAETGLLGLGPWGAGVQRAREPLFLRGMGEASGS